MPLAEQSIATFVETIILVLGASIVVVALCQRFRIPGVVGYILTGVLIGPYVFGWIKDSESIRLLSEIGVVLLLFSLGVEFSPAQMIQFRQFVLRGGAVQIIGTMLISHLGALLLGYTLLQAFALAMIISLSSTAVGVKLLKQRVEEGSAHGQLAVVILLLQDAVAPVMMGTVPLLSGNADTATALGTVLLLLVGMIGSYFAARAVMPGILRWLMTGEAREISVLGSLLIVLGMALVTEHFGLSPALGAFIAGMIIGQTPYKHQITTNVAPFRDSFLALFFISVGLMVNITFLVEHVATVVGWTTFLVAGKWAIVFIAGLLSQRPFRVGIIAGALVANIGEFSFVLISQAQQLLPPDVVQGLIASTSLSIMATPLLVDIADRLTYHWAGLSRIAPPVNIDCMQQHVIIVGYGLNGRNLAKVLRELGVSTIAIEFNGALVRQAQDDGVPVIYGDGANVHVLEAASIHMARAVVIAVSDPLSTRYTVTRVRQLNPKIPIIVRTRYVPEIDKLRALGATEVVPEEFEAFIEITDRVLETLDIEPPRRQHVVTTCRQQHYQRLRSNDEATSP